MGFLRKLLRGNDTTASGGLLPPGTVAPDFELTDHLGRTVRLRDLRGQRVVLWFYPKADTPG